jgi:hypothetical protein
MGSSEKDTGYTVTFAVPDSTRLADEELALLLRSAVDVGVPKQGLCSRNSQPPPNWISIAGGRSTRMHSRHRSSNARIRNFAANGSPSAAILNAHCGIVTLPQRVRPPSNGGRT